MIFKYISLILISFWPIFANEGLFGSTLTWKKKHHKKSNFIAMNLRVFFTSPINWAKPVLKNFHWIICDLVSPFLNRPFDFKRTQIEPEIQSSLMRFRKIPKKKSKFSQGSWAPLKYWKTKRDQARKWTEYFIFIASSPFRPLIGRPDVFFFFFFFSFFFSFFFLGFFFLEHAASSMTDDRRPISMAVPVRPQPAVSAGNAKKNGRKNNNNKKNTNESNKNRGNNKPAATVWRWWNVPAPVGQSRRPLKRKWNKN